MKNLLVVALVSLALAACSNAKDTVIPTDVSKWDSELAPKVAKLDQEDKELLAAYLARTRIGAALRGDNSKIIIGTTVGEAIENQRQFMKELAEKEAQEAAQAKALKEKMEAESKAVRDQITNSVTVTLLAKKNVHSNFEVGRYMDQQQFVIGVENKSDKPIIGVSGRIDFIDVFDKDVGAVNFDISEKIKPGGSTKWTGSRDYNQFLERHKTLWNLEEGKYTTKFVPKAVLFADGTKLRMPED